MRIAARIARSLLRLVSGSPARLCWAAAWDAKGREDWARAAHRLRWMHRMGWDSPESRFLRGAALHNEGAHAEALRELERIEGPFEDSAAEWKRWILHASALARLERAEEARAIAARAEAVAPDEGVRAHVLVWIDWLDRRAHLEREVWPRVREAWRHEDWAEVVALFSEAHASGYATDGTRLFLARGLMALECWSEALGELEAIEAPLAPPHEPEPPLLRAQCLARLGRSEEGRALLAGFEPRALTREQRRFYERARESLG